jgi:hypothetical protein
MTPILEVPTTAVEENPWNPNEQEDFTFNDLASDVAAQGLDQPIVVIKKGDGYMVVDGAHRLRAARAAGLQNVPISVKDWTEDEAKIHTVRRNAIRGHNNPKKFTALVADLNTRGLPIEEIRKRMSLSDKEFKKTYLGMTGEKAKVATEILANADKGVAQTYAVANLSQMVREIVGQFGETIPNGFIAFSFKGKNHLLISMDSKLEKAATEFAQAVKADNLTSDEMCSALAKALTALV